MTERNDMTVFFDGVGSGPALPFEEGLVRMETVGSTDCFALSSRGAAPATLGTIPFRYGNVLRLAIIAKAAFSMKTSPMEPLAAPPIHTHDVHHEGNPSARVLVASDLVPGRTRVDVTLDGHARTAFGAPLDRMTVRLQLEQHGAAAIDKALRIVGPAGGSFSMMPVGYEYAPAGDGAFATPIGVSARAHANVLDPIDRGRAAGFGPLAEAWAVRRDLLTSSQLSRIHAPVMDLAHDLDWRYFQTAPPDQQLDSLAPDAKVTIAGFDAGRPRVTAELPGASAKGVIFGLDPRDPRRPTELWFRADSLHIHADDAACVVCWRAVVEVPSEAVMPALFVVAGVETAKGRVELPTSPPSVAGVREAPIAPLEASAATNSVTASLTEEMMAEVTGPLPFAEAAALLKPPPWIVAALERGDGTGTAVPTGPTSEPLPFTPRPQGSPRPAPAPVAAPPEVDPPSAPWVAAPSPVAAPPAVEPPSAPWVAAPSPVVAKPEPPKPEPPKPEPPKLEPPTPEKPQKPAERVIQVSNATEPLPKAKKPKPKKRNPVRRVSEGVDLTALLYGKKS